MRIGRTSALLFISDILATALGFIATIYFARKLGAEVYGFYAIATALVGWLALGGNLGISSAVTKRMSEGKDQNKYFTAGVVFLTTFAGLVTLGVLLLQSYINAYIGAEVALLVLAIVLIKLYFGIIKSALKGEHKVHITGIVTPVNIGGKSVIQVGLVFSGLGLVGMLVGHIAGGIIGLIFCLYFLSSRLKKPAKFHFKKIFDFAKYSWLSRLKSRAFNDTDILVLGALVPSALVGIYSIAWMIAAFLTYFTTAINNALFPEISAAEAEEDFSYISSLLNDGLAYGGLISIPGLFGGMVLAERILRIYGDEFVQGATVFVLLILATLIYGYQNQLLNALNAIDRPDIAFRINAIFITANICLNIVLILLIGWVGAAIATILSAVTGLTLSYWYLRQILEFRVPVAEIGLQFGAGLLMSVVVLGLLNLIEEMGLIQHNVITVVLLVLVGAGLYFMTLLTVSNRFRSTLAENSPVSIPFISSQ